MRVDYPRQAARRLPPLRALLAAAPRARGIGFLALVAPVGVAYATTPIPQPERPGQRADHDRLLRRRQDRDRPLRRAEPHQRRPRPGARPRAEGGARGRGPVFYENKGISPTGIARAFWNNLRGGSTQGGSTITQQYAKNAYLTQERTYTRKLKEVFIAVKLDRRDDKDKILAGLPQHDLLRPRRLRHPDRLAGLLRQGRQRAHGRRGRGARRGHPVARPTTTRSTHADAAGGPLRLRARRHGQRGLALRGASAPACRCPRRSTTRSRKGGTNCYLLDTVRQELKAQGFTDAGDRPRRPAGHHDVRQAPQRGGREGGAPGAPDGERQGRAHRPVGGAARHRRGRRDVRRVETAGSLNEATQARGPAGLDLQGVRALGGARRTASA